MSSRLPIASLPPDCCLRRAQAEDIWAIRKLVFSARLDPTQLHWEQFWVIECQQQIIACGQLRRFPDAQELGSLVVAPTWRNQGLGRFLTYHLMEEATQPLYLECLGSRLAQFYAKLGFVPVAWQTLPKSLQRKFGLSKVVTTVFQIPLTLMKYDSVG